MPELNDRPSEHFTWAEFDCRCGCQTRPSRQQLKKVCAALETLRAALGGHPLLVTSGFRCEAHNRAVGGAEGSYHRKSMAADVYSLVHSPGRVHRTASQLRQAEGTFGGIGSYTSFTHVDIGPKRSWSG